jgi:hypothetical protein
MLVASLSAAAQDPVASAAPAETPAALSGAPEITAPNDEAASAEDRILAALEQRMDFEFENTPLSDVVEFLRNRLQINAVINEPALSEEGIQLDDRISFQARKIRCTSFLNCILRRLSLEWFIEDEILVITTKTDAIARSVAKVYDVSDLVADQPRDGETADGLQPLARAIMESVSPDVPWQLVDGEGGTVTPLKQKGLSVLVIRQSRPAHRQIAALLSDLRAQRLKTAKP